MVSLARESCVSRTICVRRASHFLCLKVKAQVLLYARLRLAAAARPDVRKRHEALPMVTPLSQYIIVEEVIAL